MRLFQNYRQTWGHSCKVLTARLKETKLLLRLTMIKKIFKRKASEGDEGSKYP